MRRTRRRTIITIITALLFGLPAWGAAQSGTEGAQNPGTVVAYDYDIFQLGQNMGFTSVNIQRGPEGYTSNSSVSVPRIFEAQNSLSARPDGTASAYTVAGTAQGMEFRIEVEFEGGGATLTLTQGETTQTLPVPEGGPFLVLDNNFIEGFQLAADQVMATGEPFTAAALVPQVAALATLQLEAPVPGTVEYMDEAVDVTRIYGVMAAGPQEIDVSIFLDGEGNILVLEQMGGGLRFVRRTADGASAGNEEPVIDRMLAQYEECLVERELYLGSTGETLYGVLTLPRAAATGEGLPAPTVLILPGSGAVSADGNVLPVISNSMYKQLAHQLACHGYGSLRIAKLGIAPSTGDANAVTMGTYASNTADWLMRLATEEGVDPQRLGLLGHSEGGLIALNTVASGRADPAAIVLVATPGRSMDVLLREQTLNSFERAGLRGPELEEMMRLTDEALEAVRNVEDGELVLEGDLADNPFVVSFVPIAGYLQSAFELDPEALALEVDAPTLVIQGLKDIQVTGADGSLLGGALQNGTLLEFADLGHNMNHVTGAPLDGALPAGDEVISPTLVQALVTWLNGYLKPAN